MDIQTLSQKVQGLCVGTPSALNLSGVPVTSRIKRTKGTLSTSNLRLIENAGLPKLVIGTNVDQQGNRASIVPKVEVQKRASNSRLKSDLSQ